MDNELEKQLLTKTIEILGEQLSQVNVDLAYTKAQNDLLTNQLQMLQGALEQMQHQEEDEDEVVKRTEDFAPEIPRE